jgi:hypothetical protein
LFLNKISDTITTRGFRSLATIVNSINIIIMVHAWSFVYGSNSVSMWNCAENEMHTANKYFPAEPPLCRCVNRRFGTLRIQWWHGRVTRIPWSHPLHPFALVSPFVRLSIRTSDR